jgi:hypothetical protein
VPETAATLVAKAKLKEAELTRLYETIKARLGTPDQQPNDIEAVAEIAHRLISVAQALLYPLPPPPPA